MGALGEKMHVVNVIGSLSQTFYFNKSFPQGNLEQLSALLDQVAVTFLKIPVFLRNEAL